MRPVKRCAGSNRHGRVIFDGIARRISRFCFDGKYTMNCRHASDCAVHNPPAYPAGPCDCAPDHVDFNDDFSERYEREFEKIMHKVAIGGIKDQFATFTKVFGVVVVLALAAAGLLYSKIDKIEDGVSGNTAILERIEKAISAR